MLAAAVTVSSSQTSSAKDKPVAAASKAPPAIVAPTTLRATLLSTLAPARPAAKVTGACPVTIESGVGIGGVLVGYTSAELKKLGLPVTVTSGDAKEGFQKVGVTNVRLLGGKVVDVWIDDARLLKDCIRIDGKSISRQAKREAFLQLAQSCNSEAPRTGGEFKRCNDGGLFFGYGMGDFLQIRVRSRGAEFTLDNYELVLTDDGTAATISTENRKQLLERVLLSKQMDAYWHQDKPGRNKLVMRKSPLFTDEPEFRMFGNVIPWVAAPAATDPYLEVLELAATKSKGRLRLAFPIEGVVATATLVPSGDTWRISDITVAER